MEKTLRITFLCILLLFAGGQSLLAQQRTIQGIVSDDKGQPLIGVSVKVKGTTAGVSTGPDGKFTLRVPSAGAMLTFSYVGFTMQERPASQNMRVIMKEQSSSLQEVVVVAFGTQKQATVTGSVSTVGGKELVSTSVSNVTNMLVGNTPGLSGLQTSGEPGRNGATIYIRGISTFAGSRDPLVVIDGVEQPAEKPYDQLNSMDANEIDNISVLKDASSTAVYGIRGANGVVIVTTKRGKLSKPVLSLASNFGVTKATDLMHNVNSYEYALMRNEAIRVEQSTFSNSSFTNNLFSDADLWKFKNNRDYTPEEVSAMSNLSDAQKAQLNKSPALYYGSRDLFSDEFGGTGPQKQLNLNISGGTPKVRYFTSLGYFDQSSILDNTEYRGANTASTFNRYNFRSNFDIDVVKNLTITVNLSGQFGTTAGPGANSAGPYDLSGRYKAIMQYIFDSNPITAPGLVDDHLINSYAGISGSADNPLGIKIGSLKGNQNAIRNLLASGTETLYNTLLANSLSFRYKLDFITPGLSIRGTANYDDNYVKSVIYSPSLPEYSVRRNPEDPNEFQFFGGGTGANTFNANPGHNSTWRKTYFDAGIDYSRTFGGHTVTGLLLGKAQKYSIPSGSENTPSGIMGLLGRVTYNFKERYLAEFNLGYNGTEQFIEGKRFGYFPAYSAGWVLSNEPFFPENKWLTFFKIRGSYGEVGNDKIGDRRYLYLPSTFNTGQAGYYWGNSDGSSVNPYYSGSVEGTIGNPSVTWEKAKKMNLGVELKFFENKLSFTGDYFKDKRDNILTSIQTIPYTYGVDAGAVPPANVGKVTNHGYEMVLGWNDRSGSFGYYLTGNLNYARNKIDFMAESQKAYPWMMQTGYSIGQYKGLVTDGFFDTQEELNNRPYNTYNANKTALGDVKYKDINGDGLIDSKDVVPVGYSNVPQYTFNLKAGFSYKNFDVSVLVNGSAKGSFNLANYQFNTPFFQTAGNVMQWQYDGRWTAEKAAKGETITAPRATMNGGAGSNTNFLASNLWIISNDFMRLKNVEVGYSLPRLSLLKKANISSVRIYANGNNLLTWNSKLIKKGVDPESTDSGGYGVYPITQVFVFGLNIRF